MTSKVSLRQAASEDLEFLQNCAREAYEKYVAQIGKEPAPMVADFASHIHAGQANIISLGEQEVGYSIHWKRQGALYVDNIALLPTAQGRGIGSTVFSVLENIARSQKCTCLELYTNALMDGPLTFYPSIGFELIDRRSEDGFDRVYFRKQI